MLSHALDLANNWQYVELWIDPTAVPPYVLLLLGRKENCCIYDPSKDYKLVFATSSYKEAKLWLLEDEYERVEGRLLMEQIA